MKIHNLIVLFLMSFTSISLQANNPDRPSVPPITDQEFAKLQLFFTKGSAEQIIASIKSNLLGKSYGTQTMIICNYGQLHKELIKAVEATKIILSTNSIPNANKKVALNNLRKEITRLYNLIQQPI